MEPRPEPSPWHKRPAGVARFAIVLALALVVGACGAATSPSPSGAAAPSGAGGLAPSASGQGQGDSAVTGLVDALRTSGATVTDLGAFNPEPLGGRGVRLCVAGQQVSVYVYETADGRAAVAGRIDPTDPSNLGTTIIEWAGNPTFWQLDRLIVLYLGRDPAVKASLTSILGQPFASGQGRDPGPDRHAC